LEWRLSSTASPRVGVRFFNPDIDPKPFITQLAEAQAEVVHESVHAFGSVVIDQMLPFRPSWEAGQDDLTWLAAPKRQSTPHIPKAGWNKPCPCGSGKKYKNCCRR
jgi:uncharacterized protein YecA (UPF0149 family)